MGTSVSQRSPNTGGWRAVAACYATEHISVERTVTEIWRAAFKQDSSLSEQLGSAPVAACIEAARRSLPSEEAGRTIEQINRAKQNNVVGEFAKRMLMLKANGGAKDETPTAVLFRQLTDYYVSRDIPGYLGEKFRCKDISQLRAFKERLAEIVAAKVQAVERREQLLEKPWHESYRIILQRLQER